MWLEISLLLKALGRELHLRPRPLLPLLRETERRQEAGLSRAGKDLKNEWFLSAISVCFVHVRCFDKSCSSHSLHSRVSDLKQIELTCLDSSAGSVRKCQVCELLSCAFTQWKLASLLFFSGIFLASEEQAYQHSNLASCSALAVKCRPPPPARLCEKPDSLFVSGTQSRALFRVWPTTHRPSKSPLKNLARQQHSHSHVPVSLALSNKCF